jgi:hypothetical protein
MSDAEFNLLDELYFITTFEELEKNFVFGRENLKDTIRQLMSKSWVKMMDKTSDEEIRDMHEFEQNYHQYNFLATKEGLLAHNSK